ncbi:MAG: hypothetical protein JW703_01875 [Candidatus Diapherotrites archaeon]|nr:hypothetical protein [Candidatus Diapherotrites archaeon]
MELHGSINGLKEAIQKDYAEKIEEINREKNAQINELRKKFKEESILLEDELQQNQELKLKELKTRVLNEQKLAAKHEFEKAREEIIQKVMTEIKQDFSKIMKSKEYLEFAKKSIPENAVVYGNPFFKNDFQNLKAEKDLMGLRFEKENIIYDLSLDALFEAKEFLIREKIANILW